MTQQDILTIKQRFGIIGNSSALNHDIQVALQVAQTDLSVLITGESGVGKEHFPQIIHYNSARKHSPYFAVNCGAIPEGTIDSELFGHERGAFTDAKVDRKGYFEIADGGTLFLDEVGELPLQTQVRLLRVLETGEFIKMGSSQVMKTNVRVVAATNMDMRQAIRDGKFREDLYYRLNTVEIKVPALRERKDDIPLLFRKFAADFSQKYHMPPVRLDEEATALLKNYYWNGNIRQLKNVAEQMSVIETNHDISAETLKAYLPANELQHGISIRDDKTARDNFMNERELLYNVLFEMKRDINELRQQMAQLAEDGKSTNPSWSSISSDKLITQATQTDRKDDDVQDAEEVNYEIPFEKGADRNVKLASSEEIERMQIQERLRLFNGNRKKAAESLGISERTLYRKIKEYEK